MISILIAITMWPSFDPEVSYRVEQYPGPRLITLPEVQQELGLSRRQAYELVRQQASRFNLIQLGRRPVPSIEARTQALSGLMTKFEPKQQKRLAEVYIQTYRESSTLDSTIAKRLGLLTRQRANIQALYDDNLRAWLTDRQQVHSKLPRPEFSWNKGVIKYAIEPLPEETRIWLEKEQLRLDALWIANLTATNQRVSKEMTASQIRKLDLMKGKPMAVHPESPFRRQIGPRQF